MIQEIRSLVRRSTPEKVRLNINEIVREVIAVTAGALAQNRVEVRTELQADIAQVSGNRVQLQQVLVNLILNGNEAMSGEESPVRTLLIQSQGSGRGEVILSVRDSGRGLGVQDMERIFDPFFSTKEGGLGLRLSISRAIVEAHEGRIWATRNEGRGPRFTSLSPRSRTQVLQSDGATRSSACRIISFMPTNNTLVSYDSIARRFASRDQLLATTQDAARHVIADPARVDLRMSQFTTGIDALQKAARGFPRVLHTPRDPIGALLQTHVAAQGKQQNKLDEFLLHAIDGVKQFFEVRLSPQDWLGWAGSFFTWIEGLEKAKQPPATAEALAVRNDLSVGILGDWGTGLYGAPVCAKSIAEGPDPYGLMLHLGDVYYAATADEVQDRFLRFWPRLPGALNRALNGNHEMYNGGHSYFEEILPGFGQASSYFALQNDDWILVGLDTSYAAAFGGHEGLIDDAQVTWLRGILAGAGDKKVVMFSHHQPFTLLDNNSGGNLLAKLGEFLDGQVFAWYWGHEHYCVLYDRHPRYGFYGRCVGHGGIPEPRKALTGLPQSPSFGSQWRRLKGTAEIPDAWAYDKPNLYVPGFEEDFAPHGFMRLEFQPKKITEYVRTPEGANVWIGDLE